MVWMDEPHEEGKGFLTMLHTPHTDENGCQKRAPKGYVPVLVGGTTAGEEEERFLVHVKLLKEPFIANLLEQAAEQISYQQGVLRVPCDAHCFQHTIDLISGGR